MAEAIVGLRAHGIRNPVVVVHTDIPTNDFTTLFDTIEQAPSSYLQLDDVFAFVAGRSFYERIFPAASSCCSAGRGSRFTGCRGAAPIPDHVYCAFAAGAARDAFGASGGGLGRVPGRARGGAAARRPARDRRRGGARRRNQRRRSADGRAERRGARRGRGRADHRGRVPRDERPDVEPDPRRVRRRSRPDGNDRRPRAPRAECRPGRRPVPGRIPCRWRRRPRSRSR